MEVVALAGGTGSAKLLRGLSKLGVRLTVVSNVGDNIWMHGLYVCPDLDIAMYTLAGMADKTQGWGVRGDTFATLRQLARLGEETWFQLGDLDLATHILRSKLLHEGRTLTEATAMVCGELGVSQPILPASDDSVQTRVRTPKGVLHLQEFWVRDRGRPRVLGVEYEGAGAAKSTREVEKALAAAEVVVVCPANPITSIGPILAVPGVTRALSRTSARITALSPMVGRRPFSGPAGKFMEAAGLRTDSVGVASAYAGFLDAILIDRTDAAMERQINGLGVDCLLTDARMNTSASEKRLAEELLKA